jgi:hypothetical protein
VELPPGWRVAHEVQPHMRRSLSEESSGHAVPSCAAAPRGPFPFSGVYNATGIFTRDSC